MPVGTAAGYLDMSVGVLVTTYGRHHRDAAKAMDGKAIRPNVFVAVSRRHFQTHQNLSEGVVADAVVVEPVSASEIPANRENNWEFFDFRGSMIDRAIQ